MDFVLPKTRHVIIPRLQFYLNPPTDTIELENLEKLAMERLNALKCVEVVGQDFIRGTKTYEDRLTSELGKLGGLAKSLTLISHQSKNSQEDIKLDIMSHFLLQIAHCRSETQRRWFIQQECELFRYRLGLEKIGSGWSPDFLEAFMASNNLHFSHLSTEDSLRLRSELMAGTSPAVDSQTTFYKVHFRAVLELVRLRKVYLELGFAFVPDTELVSLIVARFRASLSQNLSRLRLVVTPRLSAEECRLLPLLSGLARAGEEFVAPTTHGDLTARQVGQLAAQPGVFPPCMARLHDALTSDHHLRHTGRMQYGLFLKGIGLPLKESLQFWRNAFSAKMDADQFEKQHSYSIRHNYGKEGKRTDYTPYSCLKIISSAQPGTGEYHGCPFRHMDLKLLGQRLEAGTRLSSESVSAILQRAKGHHYQLACREYFKAMQGLSIEEAASVTINHPNQYFELSQRALSAATAQTPPTPSRPKIRVVKVSHGEVQSRNCSILDDTDIDMELSRIDSSLMDYSTADTWG